MGLVSVMGYELSSEMIRAAAHGQRCPALSPPPDSHSGICSKDESVTRLNWPITIQGLCTPQRSARIHREIGFAGDG